MPAVPPRGPQQRRRLADEMGSTKKRPAKPVVQQDTRTAVHREVLPRDTSIQPSVAILDFAIKTDSDGPATGIASYLARRLKHDFVRRLDNDNIFVIHSDEALLTNQSTEL